MFSHFLRKLGLLGSAKAEGSRTLRIGGRKWRLAPNATTVFGPNGPDLDRWLADGSAQIVKTGTHRTVYRVVLPGGTIYVKHCRISGSRAWVREVLRPPKARLEFENLIALQARGIAAVVPLAWGSTDSRWPGESYLITRSLEGAVPFLTFLENPCLRVGLVAETLGHFFAKLHDAGIAHPDPHPGNLLVETSATGELVFSLIDLHAIRMSGPLTWAESRANLVLFNRWFQLRACRTDRLRFWHAYRLARKSLSLADKNVLAEQARELERGTAASNLRFWASRLPRCLGTNRYFRKVKAGAIRGHVVADLPDMLLTNPDSFFDRPDSRILKDSRTSKVAAISVGSRQLILKRVNVRHWSEPLKNRLRPSALLRSWINGHTLRDRWLPTPRPLAVLHRYRLGMPAEGYLLTEMVEDAEPLHLSPGFVGERSDRSCECNCDPGEGVLATPSEPPHPPCRCIRIGTATSPPQSRGRGVRIGLTPSVDQLARMLRAMHDRSVSHRDLKASNILLERGEVPALIDLVGVRVGRPVGFRQRAKELARLNASFLTSVTRSTRLRFLRSYLAAGDCHLADWKSWWKTVSLATSAKQAKNRRSGRPLA